VSRLNSVEGFWPIFFLLVVLKIPVFGALWLVWWASQEPKAETTDEDAPGGDPKRWRPLPRPRGPHDLPGGTGSALTRRRLASSTPRRPSSHRQEKPDRVS